MKQTARIVFDCIDGYTAGNPVRLIKSPKPDLEGQTMGDKRLYFIKHYDWIRQGLMYEPRGHDMMSGSFFYPPHEAENDIAILFVETSGCLPMCGHGLIGALTFLLEEGLVTPKTEGLVNVETPAGLVRATYKKSGEKVEAVRFTNVPSFLLASGLTVECPDLGKLVLDVSFGGNFYAIIDPQENFKGIEHYTAGQLIHWSRSIRSQLNEQQQFLHPLDEKIKGCSHVLWAGETSLEGNKARNAVFYGDKAIDRSPCGTGTSARMAQWFAKGKLKQGDTFIHESIIGSVFKGKVESTTQVGRYQGLIPSIEGSARVTGYNKLILDPEDPYVKGFQVV
ncbi:MAG: 4-hydroxyproline epimerase [Flavobacteriaceae bacterium]|jgi:4-hydroxyproline epimerase